MCSTNRFPRKSFSNIYKQIPIFHEHLILATEQITIFQVAFFEYQRTEQQFTGRYPPNRYFSNRSRRVLDFLTLKEYMRSSYLNNSNGC